MSIGGYKKILKDLSQKFDPFQKDNKKYIDRFWSCKEIKKNLNR